MHQIINGTSIADSIIQNIHTSKLIKLPFKKVPLILPITTSNTSNFTFEINYDYDKQINKLVQQLDSEYYKFKYKELYFINDLQNHYENHHTFATYSVPYEILLNVLEHMCQIVKS